MTTNIPTDQINQARSYLKDAQSVLIVIGNNPNMDSMAAGLSLYLALTASGKQTSIVSPREMTVEFNHLVGVDIVGNRVNGQNGRNLIISFPYAEGSIEKVSYNIENDTFNLSIEPREGYPIVTEDMIHYSYGGGTTDLIFTLGLSQLRELGEIYQSNQTLFSQKPIINIDKEPQNAKFGKVNIIDPNIPSISELIINLFSHLGLTIDRDIASNLLAGITFGSQNFTSPMTNAGTFEAAAICLRNGARKSPADIKSAAPATLPQPFPRVSAGPSPFAFPKGKPDFPKAAKPVSQFKPQTSSYQSNPVTPIMGGGQNIKKPDFIPSQTLSNESTHPETPPDWLKPKIYKGSTLL